MSDESLDIELEYVDDPMGLGDVADEFHQSIPESVVTDVNKLIDQRFPQIDDISQTYMSTVSMDDYDEDLLTNQVFQCALSRFPGSAKSSIRRQLSRAAAVNN